MIKDKRFSLSEIPTKIKICTEQKTADMSFYDVREELELKDQLNCQDWGSAHDFRLYIRPNYAQMPA